VIEIKRSAAQKVATQHFAWVLRAARLNRKTALRCAPCKRRPIRPASSWFRAPAVLACERTPKLSCWARTASCATSWSTAWSSAHARRDAAAGPITS